ncbi:MAG: restriction endonuclease [Saccharofermentans sp.]|nr:restriction endonuclease [Saccharofermentans sp.]
MNGQKYEKRVASYLRGKGYKKVAITKTSGDYGVDIVANKMFHKYAVQCKYYAKPVGISAVQQVVAGMAYYECDRAMVVTNSTFTRQAKQLAEHNGVVLLEKVNPRSTLLTIFLLRVMAILSLYILYIMGYRATVYCIIAVAVLLLWLGLYLKYLVYKERKEIVPEEDMEEL